MIHANNHDRQNLSAANIPKSIPKSYSCKDNNSSGVGREALQVTCYQHTASAVHRNWKHVGRRLNQQYFNLSISTLLCIRIFLSAFSIFWALFQNLSDIYFKSSVLSILVSLLNVIGAQSSCLDMGPAHGCKELGATIDFHKAFSPLCLYIDLVVFGHPSLLSLGIVIFPELNAMSL